MFVLLITIILLIGNIMTLDSATNKTETATFAGGCFWCMVPPFKKLENVTIVSGYANGYGDNPTYNDYAKKGYIEAVQITFDPKKISYNTLLDIFWRQIDPTDAKGQFNDRGSEYRSAIFYHTEEQKKLAEVSKKALQESGRFNRPIVTEIQKATSFFPAEDYHQNYYEKNPWRYKFYRLASGRDQFLKKVWEQEIKPPEQQDNMYKKPSDEELRKRLTPLQYHVTQKNGTETPFKNEYWDNKRAGIYVDIVSGEVLFSSRDKFDSKTGWPSFTKPLEPTNIVTKEDKGWFSTRTEVRSKHANSHLGHLFNDGPPPTGLRYCMNSAALKFIPAQDLEHKGYGQYKKLFTDSNN